MSGRVAGPGHDDPSAGLPSGFATTRGDLQRLATHVLARARAGQGGRFGLRVTATGIGTPPFGPEETVVRLTGAALVVERQAEGGRTAATRPLAGLSLADAAAFVGVDLDEPFAPGAGAPAPGDRTAALSLGPASVGIVLGWYGFGAQVLDAVLPRLVGPAAAQLWPEHFDLGLSAATGTGGVNLGASPGDAGVAEPYLYVAPWADDRPGDPGFWNAPYGAVITRSTLAADPDPGAAGTGFLLRGLDLLAG